MTISGQGVDIYAPTFTVKLGDKGKQITKDHVLSVEVDEKLNSPTMFTVALDEKLDMNSQRFMWLDDERIAPGVLVRISFGYASKPGKQALIRGRIKGISPGFTMAGPTLKIEGYDLSHDLQKTEGDLSYEKARYSKIVKMIARENDLKPDGIETTEIEHPIVRRKKNEKDYSFIKRLAKKIGFEFFVRDATLYFRKPRDDRGGAYTFEFRKNFLGFSPRMTTATVVSEVRVMGWDEKKKESFSEKATLDDIRSGVGVKNLDKLVSNSQKRKTTVRLESRVAGSPEEARAIARSELKKRNQGLIQGTLECAGNPLLRPGMSVDILKIGKRFSGVYYIIGARHSIGDGGYKTTLELRGAL